MDVIGILPLSGKDIGLEGVQCTAEHCGWGNIDWNTEPNSIGYHFRMHSLVQTEVMRASAIAALLTTACCIPRLLVWGNPHYAHWFLVAVLAWASFILWSFVLGWHKRFLSSPPITIRFPFSIWAIATAAGLLTAATLHWLVDPTLRRVAPHEFPSNLMQWARMVLFDISFVPLFVTFAPFDFFLRLARRPERALCLTLGFGLFLLSLKIGTLHHSFGTWELASLFGGRFVLCLAETWLYWKAGIAPALWLAALIEIRHLIQFVGNG